MMNEQKKIDLMNQSSLDINEVKDIDLLLERILTNARKFFDADAGSIYLKEGDQLKFSYTQNTTLQERLPGGKKLIYNTFSIPIDNMSVAGYVAKNKTMVNIPDVYKINSSVPYTFDPLFDELSDYRTCSMLTVPILNQRKVLLGVMQVINAQENGKIVAFNKSDESLVLHFAINAGLAMERAQTTRNIILRMISMAELRDPKETGAHVNRVGAYSVEIFEAWAKKKGFPQAEIDRQKDLLRMAAMLHDVGKVAISDLILKKPDRLTLEEFEAIKSHTYLGARLFQDIQSDLDEVSLEVVMNHHEKWDGTGYPGHIDPFTVKPLPGHGKDGQPFPKKGEEIPLLGRIVAVADVYDALNSRRSYKAPWDEKKITREIRVSSGSHFDPDVVAAFFECLEILKVIGNRYPDE
jgi:HD-GYP domain-containing protein (c-di-GMP phosphodiesterase class II)